MKRAYMSGHKRAKYTLRGNRYECDFVRMKQKNIESGRERDIRPPHKMKPPSKPLVPSGPVMVVKVPPCSAGKIIQVPHPQDKSQMISVQIPNRAHVGQAMTVPVPPLGKSPADIPTPARARIPTPSAPPASGRIPVPSAPADAGDATASGTASKKPRKDIAGVGLAGAALAGGAVVTGGIIGDAIWDVDIDSLDLGDIAIEDALEDVSDSFLDIGAEAGDFIMDLF